MNIYMHEFNIVIEKAAWVPFSTGSLQAYSSSIDSIRDNYNFMESRFVKQPVSQLDSYNSPEVAAFSTYMWNYNMNLAVAEGIKKDHPECLVVFGGPSAPYDPSFLNEHPFIDVVAYGEGEQTFSNLLVRNLESRNFEGIPSISYRLGDQVIRNPGEPPFVKDLDIYPSPYLSGTFDYLLGRDTKFQVIVESNRGCPFSCSYCFWGQGTMKMGKRYRYFSLDRMKEIADWCGRNEIEYMFCADSNFGIHKRDVDVARCFVDAKDSYGAPDKFRVCYAKNSESNVYEIAKILHGANMEKAVTLARQSNNPDTLVNIGRSNIKMSSFNSLAKKCSISNIPIYTEIILGLPGETYDSFVSGISDIMEESVNTQILIYCCSVLPNTVMDLPEYRSKHGIGTAQTTLTEQHYKIHGDDDVKEQDEIIISTNSMDLEDWKRSLIFAWFTQMLYSLRSGIFIILYLQYRLGLKPTEFIECVIANSQTRILSQLVSLFNDSIDSILQGDIRDAIFPGSPIYWPVEEVAFIMITENKNDFYVELYDILTQYLLGKGVVDYQEVKDVVTYQKACIPAYGSGEKEEFSVSHSVVEFFEDIFNYRNPVITKNDHTIMSYQPIYQDFAEFTTKVVVWGRKSGSMLRKVSVV